MNIFRNSKLYIIFHNSYLNLLVLRLRNRYRDIVVSKKTIIVVEGFPRSANTFAFHIFRKSLLKMNIDSLGKIGHHIHTTAQIKTALKKKIPILVIIRSPEEAIASYILKRYGTNSVKNIEKIIDIDLYYWIYFYSMIYKLRKHLVISDFGEVISKYDKTIEKINERFDKKFAVIKPTEKISNEILDNIKKLNLPKVNFNEKLLAVPSDKKHYEAEILMELIVNSNLYYKAKNIFDSLS